MTKREIHFSNILRSRGIAFLIILFSIWMMSHALALGKVGVIADDMSVAFPVASSWFPSPVVSMWVNAACVLLTARILVSINATFNLLRTMSVFFSAFFVFATASIPDVGARFGAHTLLAIIGVIGIWLMFSLYNVRRSDRRIFLIFFLLGAGAMVNYATLLYVPIFLTGLWQMRIFRLKKLLSAGVGLLVPLWIVYGLDILPLPTSMPDFYFTPPTDIEAQVPGGWPAIIGAALTLFIAIAMGAVNVVRFLRFNARMRAYNGFLTLICTATGVFAIINFTNLPFYLMLLNACVAFHVGHFFRITASRRGYIPILITMGCYGGLYYWSLL